jgi:arabinogalactan oligomer/maltooligosaccharide transport system substrate-binding protein
MSMSGCGGDSGTPAATEPAVTEPAETVTEEPAETTEPAVEGEAPDRADADLVIWADNDRYAALQAPVAEWAAANGVTVAVQAVPNDQLQALAITADQQGNGPDVLVGAQDWIGNLVQNGSIVPVTIPNTADYPASVLAATQMDGQTFGVPYAVETLVLFANTDLVPDATAPATIEDMIAAGEASGAERTLCLPLGTGGDAYHMEPIFTAGGGYIFGQNADGSWNPDDIGVDSPGGLAAAEKIGELGQEGILSTSITGDNAIPLFADGNCAYLISGPWAISSLEAAGTPYTISTIPGFEGGPAAAPFMGVQMFFVMAHAHNPAFAQQFVQDVAATTDITYGMFQTDQRPPAQISLANEVAAQYPDMAKIAEAAANATPMPAIPEMSAIWGPLGQAHASVVDGADPTTTFQDAATAIRNAIAAG